MKIRALTLGYNLQPTEESFTELRSKLTALKEVKEQLKTTGMEVEYIRLCTIPLTAETSLTEDDLNDSYQKMASFLESLVQEKLLGIYAFASGLYDQADELTDLQKCALKQIPSLFAQFPNLFSSIQVASTENGINFQAIHDCVDVILQNGLQDPFSNLRFAVTMNVPPNTPFFPSAYHLGETSKLSVALEAADEIIQILETYPPTQVSLTEIKQHIQDRFTAIYDELTAILIPFCDGQEIQFEGIDFSPAQYATPETSIGTALERLGLCEFGQFGSVFVVGFLTQAIQSIDRPKIGFSGFMQPLLEDFTIGLRNKEGKVDLSKLMLYSTMCGLGLDCIPIPGDADPETLQLLLMDLAMVSMRLNKPLTARLMPVPGKSAGDITEFEFEYFVNSAICAVEKSNISNLDAFRQQNLTYRFKK